MTDNRRDLTVLAVCAAMVMFMVRVTEKTGEPDPLRIPSPVVTAPSNRTAQTP